MLNEPDDDIVEDTEDNSYEDDDYEKIIDNWDYNYGDHEPPELFPYAEPY